MKRILFTVVAVAATLLAVPMAASAQTDGCTPADETAYTTEVTDRPDSGTNGNWATDTFTRTTTVACGDNGAWLLTLADSGTFTTIGGATSPGDEANQLPDEPFTGKFEGSAKLAVTATTKPHEPQKPAAGWPSSSDWAGTMWNSGATTPGATDWGWTYTYCDQQWVNAEDGNHGDVVGGVDCSAPPTTTAPPTSTTPPVADTTSAKPAALQGGDSDNSSGTGSGDALAETGVSDATPWIIGGGALLLLGGGSLVLLARRRGANREH